MTISFMLAEGAEGRADAIGPAMQQAASGTIAGLKHDAETGERVGTELPGSA